MGLPPGQKYRSDFPRFGLPQYAERRPSNLTRRSIAIEVNGTGQIDVDLSVSDLRRLEVQSDFHCVTTWSYPGVKWGGVSFREFFHQYVEPLQIERIQITGAILYAQDGYKTTLLLDDLLNEGVMLADELDGQPLTIEHGAPLRLVAPEHYGYKNLKHLKRIEFYTVLPVLKRGIYAFLDHPRARVLAEERARGWIPAWAWRLVFRLFIARTVQKFSTYQSNGRL